MAQEAPQGCGLHLTAMDHPSYGPPDLSAMGREGRSNLGSLEEEVYLQRGRGGGGSVTWSLVAPPPHPPTGDPTRLSEGGNGSLYGTASAAGLLYRACLGTSPISATYGQAGRPALPWVGDEAISAAAPPLGPTEMGGHRRFGRYGRYIVTGGSGMVAGHVAMWLSRTMGAAHVHLVSRSGGFPDGLLPALLSDRNCIFPPSDAGSECLLPGGGLGGRWGTATVFTASKADPSLIEDAAWVMTAVQPNIDGCGGGVDADAAELGAQELGGTQEAAGSVRGGAVRAGAGVMAHPLLGTFHAAGVLDDAMISRMTLSAVRRTAAPKPVALARFMAAAGPGIGALPCQTHVMFSSVASLLGSPGQSNYAAANAALDAQALAMQVGQDLFYFHVNISPTRL